MNTTLITVLTLAITTTIVGIISTYCEKNATDNEHYSNI